MQKISIFSLIVISLIFLSGCMTGYDDYDDDFHPLDRISNSSIKVYSDRILIEGSFGRIESKDTSSMKPTFSCENTLYFCSARKEEIKIGDIIAFLTPEYVNDDYETFYTIHRIINIISEGYVTKGDGNIYIDEFVIPYKNVFGKLWRIDG